MEVRVPNLTVISLGWGVQSFALACMSALGVLPPVDAAVHADTGHERSETYALAEEFTPWLEARGVRVVTVRAGRPLIEHWGRTGRSLSIPARTTWPDGRKSGMLRRQCTGDWKIDPMRRWCSAELKRQGLRKTPGVIEKWLGITHDEDSRMSTNDVKYINLAYPFIKMFDRAWTRTDVKRWLCQNDLPIPVKSSCVFCPYHCRNTWRQIKLANNGDWEKAVAADRAIRSVRANTLAYLTAACKPLPDCDFSSQEDHGQLTLWEEEECSGMCFL